MAQTKEPKKQVPLGEISTQTSLLYAGIMPLGYNPDDLVQKKGLAIYKKMREDDQVKAVLLMKKYAVLANPWTVVPASNEPQDKEVAEYIKDQFDGMEGIFEDALMNVLTALDYGFSVTEVIYKMVEEGKWKGKIGLKKLATREPFNYDFDYDEHGNLKPDGIKFQGTNKYPQDKFIIFSYRKEFSNWYGQSDLRAAYRSWWSKEILIRFHNMYLERFGMPTTIGKYKKGTSPDQVTKLRTVIENIQTKYAITIPDDIIVELLQSGSQGEVQFHTAIEMHNKFIARSVLVPDLIGYTEHTGGGFALGKKQFDVFLWILKKLSRDIEENIVGEQLIKKLVDFNFTVEKYPQFQFQAITEEDTEAKARIVRLGVDGGFINPEEPWVRNYLNLPPLTEGFTLQKPQTVEGAPAGLPQPEGKEPAMGKKGQPGAEKGTPEEDLWVSALAPKMKAEEPVRIIERVIEVPDSKELKELRDTIKIQRKELSKLQEQGAYRKDLQEMFKKQEKAISKLQNKLEMVKLKKSQSKVVIREDSSSHEKLQETLVDEPILTPKRSDTEPISQFLGGLNWVIRCPYPGCGSEDIHAEEEVRGGFIYSCDTCDHLFKVLKEGDVYFYDSGKEEWVRQGGGIRPSYFTYRDEYQFIQCPYSGCAGDYVKLQEKVTGGSIYKCSQCGHIFKILNEGDLYFFDSGKDKWFRQNGGGRPSYFKLKIRNYVFSFNSLNEIKERLKMAKAKGLSGLEPIEVMEE